MTVNRLNDRKWRQRIVGLTALVLALLSAAAAQPTQIKFDPAKTRIEWTLGAVLHTVQGSFHLKSGAILFDSRTGDASGALIVDAASGRQQNARLKDEQRGAGERSLSGDYVRSEARDRIRCQSGNFNHSGRRELHDPRRQHELTLTVPVSVKPTNLEAQTNFSVPYDAWGMKNPSTLFLKVDKEVKISITAVGDLQPPAATRSAH